MKSPSRCSDSFASDKEEYTRNLRVIINGKTAVQCELIVQVAVSVRPSATAAGLEAREPAEMPALSSDAMHLGTNY